MVFVRRDIRYVNWKDHGSRTRDFNADQGERKYCPNAKTIEELQEKVGVERNKGDGKGKNKNQGTTKGNGPKDKNGYYLCGTCGKRHKGVCFKLDNVTQ